MTFLRNAWYVAGWSQDFADKPISRTYLDEPVVMYRTTDGALVALADICSHRFAPLSLGRQIGDTIRCPYHGLVFDKNGTCIHNPHGKGLRPAALNVRAYPIYERDGLAWIWMGNADLAAQTQVPAYPFLSQTGMKTISGYTQVNAHYELVTDNLMDLSHVEFLHPFLAPEGYAASLICLAQQRDNRVSSMHEMPDQPNTPLFALVLGDDVKRIDGYARTDWEAPANMYLEIGATSRDVDAGRRVIMPQVHLLTPETETRTHYFWAISRDVNCENAQLDHMLLAGIDNAFRNEDEPMLQAVASRMRNQPLFSLSPAILPMDEAAVRARRILANRIDAEQKADHC